MVELVAFVIPLLIIGGIVFFAIVTILKYVLKVDVEGLELSNTGDFILIAGMTFLWGAITYSLIEWANVFP